MAEEKRSFILYADILHTVKKLPKDKAGELFLTILEYVNDLNPQVDDMLIDLVFEPIKQQLKRDLRHWEGIKVRRSEAGRKGGIKSGETRREANEANASKGKQNEANEAVNVNVSVNVNEDVNSKDKSLVELPAATTTAVGSISERAIKFVTHFNKTKLKFTGAEGRYRATDEVLRKFKSRVKDYKPDQIVYALNKAFTHQMHKEQNYQYLTPSYILREEILERYLNINDDQLKSNKEVYKQAPKPIDHASRA